MNIVVLKPGEVDEVWPHISGMMQSAFEQTEAAMSPADMWTLCRSGNAFLIVGIDEAKPVFASAWRFETWATGRVFRCLYLGGERMHEWFKDMHDLASRMAADGGTKRLVAEGRPGWARIAEKYTGKRTRKLWEMVEVE